MDLLRFLFLLGIVGFVGYQVYLHIYLAFWHPQEYAKFKQMQHEKEMAKQTAKLAAARDARSKMAGNVVGVLAKIVLATVFNHKRH